MKGVKAKWGWMREAEFRSLVRGSGTHRDTRHRPPSPAGVNLWRFNPSLSADARGTITLRFDSDALLPKIEALEPECRGVSWGVGPYEYPQAPDIKGKMGEELKPQ